MAEHVEKLVTRRSFSLATESDVLSSVQILFLSSTISDMCFETQTGIKQRQPDQTPPQLAEGLSYILRGRGLHLQPQSALPAGAAGCVAATALAHLPVTLPGCHGPAGNALFAGMCTSISSGLPFSQGSNYK